mmetsp:Transcript_18574/g.57371  ORF Transcript_18574/g.57371 Transcript_18574/m.57371 type:complete len:204 (-) Transcript_18574:15-626(-)
MRFSRVQHEPLAEASPRGCCRRTSRRSRPTWPAATRSCSTCASPTSGPPPTSRPRLSVPQSKLQAMSLPSGGRISSAATLSLASVAAMACWAYAIHENTSVPALEEFMRHRCDFITHRPPDSSRRDRIPHAGDLRAALGAAAGRLPKGGPRRDEAALPALRGRHPRPPGEGGPGGARLRRCRRAPGGDLGALRVGVRRPRRVT